MMFSFTKIAIISLSLLANSESAFLQPVNDHGNLSLTKVAEFTGYRNARFSRDGKKLAFSGTKHNLLSTPAVEIRSLPSQGLVCRVEIPDLFQTTKLSFSPDARLLSISSAIVDLQKKSFHDSITVVDAQTCAEKLKIDSPTEAEFSTIVEFSKDGRNLVGSTDVIQIWDAASGAKGFHQNLPDGLTPVNTSLSPDGKWLVILGKRKSEPAILIVMDMESKKITRVGTFGYANWKFSSDSKILYVSGEETDSDNVPAKFRIYTVGAWELGRTLELTGANRTFDISESKRLIAAGGNDGKFRLFSLETGEKLSEEYYYKRTAKDDEQRVPQMISVVGPVEFSPDGTILMTAGGRGNVILWKLNRSLESALDSDVIKDGFSRH